MFGNIDEYSEERIRHYAGVIWCHKIIKEFFKIKEATPELRAKFEDWLLGNYKRKEKDIALAITLYEQLSVAEPTPLTKADNEIINRIITGVPVKAEV